MEEDEMAMRTFDDIMRNVDGYHALPLDTNNDRALSLLADGLTAVVTDRSGGGWVEADRFIRETYWKGGCWSDLDVSRAINGPN